MNMKRKNTNLLIQQLNLLFNNKLQFSDLLYKQYLKVRCDYEKKDIKDIFNNANNTNFYVIITYNFEYIIVFRKSSRLHLFEYK